jgi:hypothetical protein
MPIKHAFESAVADGGDPDLVGPDEWNADHDTIGMAVVDASRRFVLYEDCAFRSATAFYSGGLIAATGGTSAALGLSTETTAGHPGIIFLTTGTTASGRASFAGTTSGQITSRVTPAIGIARCVVIARIGSSSGGNALSDGTDTFTARHGFGSETVSTSPADGVFFRYTHSVNSGKWEAVCRASSVETATDTGVTADLNWHRFEIITNAGWTSIDFKIDGSLVATVTTNIPTADLMPIPGSIHKTLGGTARSISIDALEYTIDFTTAR